jgi:hypothetical protein
MSKETDINAKTPSRKDAKKENIIKIFASLRLGVFAFR